MPPGPPSAEGTQCILVIENDRACRQAISAILQQAKERKFDVSEAADISAAEQVLQSHAIDAIILDLHLDDTQGIETLAFFRDAYSQIPLVVYTGNEDPALAIEAIRLGAQEYITKSHANPAALVHHLILAIERKQLEQKTIKAVDSVRLTAESQLAEFEDRFQGIIEHLPGITYILDADNDYKPAYISPQVEEILGYSVEDWFEDPTLFRNLIHKEDRDWVIENSAQCFASGQNVDLIYRVTTKTDEIVWFKDHASAKKDEQGNITHVHGVLLDITRRKSAESALKKRDQQLQQSQKMHAVGRLAGGIAHEFNNLLTSILGFSYLLLDEVEEDHPHHEYAEQIVQSGERASDLIRQMLAFSNKQTNKVENFNLNDLITNLDKIVRKSIDPNVDLSLDKRAAQANIKGDKNQLEQILMRLVGNAEDAMENAGKIVISTSNEEVNEEEAEIRKCTPGTYICLSVKDTGKGIDPKILDKIYDPFFSTKEVGQGVGLGLSIVYTNVEQHKGYIDIQSEPDKGTNFRILFPTISEPGSAKPTPDADLPRGQETILLIEDEDSVRNVTVRTLESLGYHILPATNGGEAILITETYNKPIDLLLTDFAMPKLNGKKLVDRLRQDHSEFKVLYTSGYDRETVGSQNEEVYETNFIKKPYNKDNLAFMVRQVLDEEKRDTNLS